MKKCGLVVGGSNGIGLGFAEKLLAQDYEKVYIVDKTSPPISTGERLEYHRLNLLDEDYGLLSGFADIDTLIITAGFGRVAHFDTFTEAEIVSGFTVNAIAPLRILLRYMPRLQSADIPFTCIIMGSIAGLISSPLFAVYGAAKAALCKFIESLNIELEMTGACNRVLNVAPGTLKGTRFGGGENDTGLLGGLIDEIFAKAAAGETLFIPDYDKTFRGVLARYHDDPAAFGQSSYTFKKEGGRLNPTPQV